jgi:uncharacterized protein YeeX (DUF496 family)
MIKIIKAHLLFSITIFSMILLLVPIVVFLYHFGGNTISKDLNVWASFGDFMGGTVNTILSLSSLIILGFLTNLVSKQSNDENKKVNLLLKRLDSYEKLTDYMPKINQIVSEMNIDLGDINDAFENNNDDIGYLLREFEKKSKFFIELYVVIQTFGIRYGHLYNYNFDSKEFASLSENIAPTREYFSQILLQLKRRQPDFPPFPYNEFKEFLNTFVKVINQLKVELY